MNHKKEILKIASYFVMDLQNNLLTINHNLLKLNLNNVVKLIKLFNEKLALEILEFSEKLDSLSKNQISEKLRIFYNLINEESFN